MLRSIQGSWVRKLVCFCCCCRDSTPCDFTAQPLTEEEEEVVKFVVTGTIPSYSRESKLGDCRRAAAIRREALQRITGMSLGGLPLEGFDYESILGQCCELPVGYVQIPDGIAGPLMLDGRKFSIPMATTEGCLAASANRGFKSINLSGVNHLQSTTRESDGQRGNWALKILHVRSFSLPRKEEQYGGVDLDLDKVLENGVLKRAFNLYGSAAYSFITMEVIAMA